MEGGIDQRELLQSGEESEPQRSKSLQSSPAHWHQTSLQGALGDLNSLANFQVQLNTEAAQVQAPAKISAACFVADTLAWP